MHAWFLTFGWDKNMDCKKKTNRMSEHMQAWFFPLADWHAYGARCCGENNANEQKTIEKYI